MRWIPFCFVLAACGPQQQRSVGTTATDAGATDPVLDLSGALTNDAPDAAPDLREPSFDPDAACASVEQDAVPTYLPLDIIWIIDNSSSMAPAIDEVRDGMNDFASLIGGTMGLDYRIVMLSLRGATSPVQVGGSNRYPICIPPPLAGGTACENGPRFFHSSVDIKSTETLEQVLGTLAQTSGYTAGADRGGEPWQSFLRPSASKTFVIVSDDNARLSATQFETFAGGKNPFNSTTLPPGILDPSWNGLFAQYTFSGIYGWGSASDPSVRCQYADGSSPSNSGATYTTLVGKTNGVRAQICGDSSTWSSFFTQVATAVTEGAKLSCTMTLPPPPGGLQLDPSKVNVSVVPQSGAATALGKVTDAAACGSAGGWYYDDDANPTEVILCPATCATAQSALSSGGRVSIAFGCATIIV
jgi:hypothetical protein